ncbi:hypothetical protein ABZ297_36575 [Nonomuraea sp. NPDC005983]|uniref:hypothetical protein n=1 Tax=Nonomuraea sp. NPDC005983 TaxID=3155595 RepID=UPI0033B6BA6C
MKRAGKAAVAVATFGLAVALAAPAYASDDPLGGLLGRLLGGGSSLGGLSLSGGPLGGGLPGVLAASGAHDALGQARMGVAGESGSVQGGLDGVNGAGSVQGRLNSVNGSGSVQVNGVSGSGGVQGGLDTISGPGGVNEPGGVQWLLAPVAGLGGVGGPGGVRDTLSPADGLAGAASGTLDDGADSLSGLDAAVRQALPSTTPVRLAPLPGKVAPSETAPVVRALPGVGRAATVDGIAPLVEDAARAGAPQGVRVADAYNDVLTGVAWATERLTAAVGR